MSVWNADKVHFESFIEPVVSEVEAFSLSQLI